MKIGLVFVIKAITFLTVDDSSASGNWSSSSPDMAFSFPLQRPIFCPAKKSPNEICLSALEKNNYFLTQKNRGGN